jgi:hypothetical protein
MSIRFVEVDYDRGFWACSACSWESPLIPKIEQDNRPTHSCPASPQPNLKEIWNGK